MTEQPTAEQKLYDSEQIVEITSERDSAIRENERLRELLEYLWNNGKGRFWTSEVVDQIKSTLRGKP